MVVQAVHGVIRGDGARGGAADWAGLFGADEAEGDGSAVAVSYVMFTKALVGILVVSSPNHGDFLRQASFQPAISNSKLGRCV